MVLALVPAVSAVAVLGRLHPDEVYQFLEPAFARVHGYGVLAWEWKSGLRNWAVPLVLAAVLRVGSWLGLTDPWVARGLLAVPLWALQAWGLVAAARLGRRRAGTLGGWVTVVRGGVSPALRGGAGRTLGESLSVPLLLVAAEALCARRAAPGQRGSSGARRWDWPSWCATARCRRSRRLWPGWRRVAGGRCSGGPPSGLGAVLLALGALDWATWGSPWHSVRAWFAFNVGSSGAARTFGAEAPSYYWPFLWTQVPKWVWPALVLGACVAAPARRRCRGDGRADAGRPSPDGAQGGAVPLSGPRPGRGRGSPGDRRAPGAPPDGMAARRGRGWGARAHRARRAALDRSPGRSVPGDREGDAAAGGDRPAHRERGALGLGRLLLRREAHPVADLRLAARPRVPGRRCATGASTGW